MNTQYHISQFERYIKRDPHWRKVYMEIDKKIKSNYDYKKLFEGKKKSAQKTLKSFEIMVFQSDQVETISTKSGKELFEAFIKFYSQTRNDNGFSKYKIPTRKGLKKVLEGLERRKK